MPDSDSRPDADERTAGAGGSAGDATAGDVAAREWDRRYRSSGDDLVWSASANQFVVELLADVHPGRALDVAAGEGRNALWLARLGWDVTAVDVSAVAMQRASRLAAEAGLRLTTEVVDVTTWRPEAGGYDLVLLAYLQLPESQLAPALDASADAVGPGGRFLLVAHHADNLVHGYGGPPRADLLTSVEQVTDRLVPAFTLDVAEPRQRRVDTADGPRTAIDTVVLATRRVS